MKCYMDELMKIGALDEKKKLTHIGFRLAAFSSLSPFVSSSILKVSDKYKDDTAIANIVGSLAFLVISTGNIFIDPFTDTFRRNFCEDSDIITLMSSLLELMSAKGSLRKRLSECGFHPSNGIKLIGTVEQIASIIYDDDKNSLWNDINDFYKSHDMMQFIQEIITEIEHIRPDWVSCRKSEYVSVVDVLNNYKFIYKGDKSLTEDEKVPEITVRMRPGGKGFAAPGACFIMQFNCKNKKKYAGAIIHRDLSRKEICHPTIIETSIMMNNAFTVPLIEGYIGEHLNEFKPFQKTIYNKENTHGSFICYPEQFGDKTIISYVSQKINDDNVKNLIEDAIQKAQKILPFTPRTILVKNDILKSIVAVTGFGSKNYTTQIIDYKDKCPIPYNLDKTIIDYLINHINELSDIDGHLVIAMTGEKFSYGSVEEEDFIGNPISWAGAPCVFGLKSDFYSHLVVLSNKPIPNATSLNWVDRKIPVTYWDVDSLIHVSNHIYRGVVEITHEFDMIYFMNRYDNVIVDGIRPQFNDTTQDSNVFRPIGCMFDSYAMNCIKGSRLINNVDLKGFSLSENINCDDLKNDIIAINSFKKKCPNDDPFNIINDITKSIPDARNLRNYYDQRKNAFDQLSIAKNEMRNLTAMFNDPNVNKKNIKSLQSRNKATRERLNKIISNVNPKINQINDSLKSFCTEHNLDEKIIRPIISVNTPKEIHDLYKITIHDSYIEIKARVDDRDDVIKTVLQYRNDLVPDIVPMCSIVVSHNSNSNISKETFVNKINDICQKFGGVIKSKSDYQETEKSRLNKGIIRISLLTGEFAILFAGEILNAIGLGDKAILKIPTKIIPICLLNRPDVVESIDSWVENQGLNLHKTGMKYTGTSKEIEKAMLLLSKKETQPKIPYKPFTIPGGIEISKVISAIGRKNSKLTINSRWGINKTARLIYVPDEIDDEIVQEFINSFNLKDKKKTDEDEEENEIIYDYLYCCEETAVLSGIQMPFYQQDGSSKLFNYCVTCGYDFFKTEIGHLYDQEEDKPKMNLICENTNQVKFIELFDNCTNDPWPEIPLGQMLWCLVSENVMNVVTRTWFSALVYQALHSSQLFNFCPNHPGILIRERDCKIICTQHGCNLYLCEDCHQWHFPGKCKMSIELPPGFRMCPG